MVEGIRKGLEKRERPKSPFNGRPENPGENLDRDDQEQEGQVKESGQLVVPWVGGGQEVPVLVPGRGEVVPRFPDEGLEKGLSLTVRKELGEPAERASLEEEPDSAGKKEDEGIPQINVGFLEGGGCRFREPQFLVPVEEEIAFKKQQDDQGVGPVPDSETGFPDRDIIDGPLRI